MTTKGPHGRKYLWSINGDGVLFALLFILALLTALLAPRFFLEQLEMTSLSVKASTHFVMYACVKAESDPILLILRPLLYVPVSPTGFDRALRRVTKKTSAAGRPFGTRRALP
jgi:hypothetical protein